MAETVIRQEFDRAGVPHRGNVQGTHMLVPTLLECGTEEQRREYIEPTLTRRAHLVPGLQRAGRGQRPRLALSRAPSSSATSGCSPARRSGPATPTEADMMFGLFRTEPDAPKHAGISYLLIPMKTPGIDVRPLAMMQGGVDFCEVFFDGARIPAQNIVGQRGEGWKVSRSTLKHERMLIGDSTGARMAFDALVALARAGAARRPARDRAPGRAPAPRRGRGLRRDAGVGGGAHAHRDPPEPRRAGDERDADDEALRHEPAADDREARARPDPRGGSARARAATKS